jgi:hypothetical protein
MMGNFEHHRSCGKGKARTGTVLADAGAAAAATMAS